MDIKQFDLKVGNDNGNSGHKMIIDGELILQPNVYYPIRKMPCLDELNPDYVANNIMDNMICSIETPVLNNGVTGTYYVGTYATKSGKMLKNIEVGAFNSKVDSDVPVVNTLSVIASYAASKAYKEDKGIKLVHANVDMTTSIPVAQYSKDNANTFANKFLEEVHKVHVHLGSNKVEVIVRFTFVQVLPESVPIVHYLKGLFGNNELFKGIYKELDISDPLELFTEFADRYEIKNLDGSFFNNKRILHVAPGEGTTEYPVTNDIRFDPNFIEGSNNGVGHAINKVLNPFIKLKRLAKYSRQDFSEVLKTPSHKYYGTACELIEEHLDDQAEVILGYVKDEVGKANNELDLICTHGGGSILMKDVLNKELIAFGKATDIKVLYIDPKIAVIIEVLGLFAYASSPMFLKVKKLYLKSVSSK